MDYSKYGAISDEEFQARMGPSPGIPQQNQTINNNQNSVFYKWAMAHPDAARTIEPALQNITKNPTFIGARDTAYALESGLKQGVEDERAALLNLVPGVKANKKDFSKDVSHAPTDRVTFEAGSMAAPIVAFYLTRGSLGKIPSLSSTSLPASLTKGALAGAATSENRGLGAALGALGSPTFELGSKGILNRISSHGKAMKKEYSESFNGLFQKLKDKGINRVDYKPSDLDIEAIRNAPQADKESLESFEKYINDPTVENAHWAQSDLGKIARKSKLPLKLGNLSSSQIAARNSVLEAQQKINSEIDKTLTENAGEKTSAKYFNLREGYNRDVVPYFNEAIQRYGQKKGGISAMAAVNKLKKDPDFAEVAAKYHPDLLRRDLVSKGLKLAGKSALKGLGFALPVGLVSATLYSSLRPGSTNYRDLSEGNQ